MAKIRKISQETIVRDKSKWLFTRAISVAERVSKEWDRTIYQIPNGAYVIRVPKQKLKLQNTIKKHFWNE